MVGTGLVAVDRAVARRNTYMEQFGKTTSKSTEPDGDASAAKWAGYQAGRETEIRKGVNGASEQAAEQLGTGEGGRLLLS